VYYNDVKHNDNFIFDSINVIWSQLENSQVNTIRTYNIWPPQLISLWYCNWPEKSYWTFLHAAGNNKSENAVVENLYIILICNMFNRNAAAT